MRATVSAKILPDALRSRCTYGVHTAVTFRTCQGLPSFYPLSEHRGPGAICSIFKKIFSRNHKRDVQENYLLLVETRCLGLRAMNNAKNSNNGSLLDILFDNSANRTSLKIREKLL